MSSKPNARVTRRTALLGLTALAGCGFEPVYGDRGMASAFRDHTAYITDDSVVGYRIAQRLTRRLGQSSAPTYALTVKTSITENNVAIDQNDKSTRVTVIGEATYSLTAEDGTVIDSGIVDNFTGYSTTGSIVAIRAAEDDAYDRLAVALADQVIARVMAAAASL